MTRPLCVLPLMFGFRLLLPGQVTVANPSFETPSVDGPCPKFLYDPKGASWTVTGITTAGCAAGFNAPGPVIGGGLQVAFIQSSGNPGIMSQPIGGLVPGRRYVIKFYAAGRPARGCDKCGPLNFAVFAGETKLLDVENPDVWQFINYTTAAFVATSDTETISFRGTAHPGLDETAFIDMVSVVEASAQLQDPAPFTGEMMECEGKGGCGIFRLNGKTGSASWPNGAEAQFLIERLDKDSLVIRRTDPPISTVPGLSGLYLGKLDGSHASGTVAWSWHGGETHGVWSAVTNLTEISALTVHRTPSRTGDGHRAVPPALADLNGTWETTKVIGDRFYYDLAFQIEQKEGAIRVLDATPNHGASPTYAELFHGTYAPPIIEGQELRNTGWVPARLTVIYQQPIFRTASSHLRAADYDTLRRSQSLRRHGGRCVQARRGRLCSQGFKGARLLASHRCESGPCKSANRPRADVSRRRPGKTR